MIWTKILIKTKRQIYSSSNWQVRHRKWSKESSNWKVEKVKSTKASKCVKSAQRSIMKRKTLTGHVEHMLTNMEERFGGAAERGAKINQVVNSQSISLRMMKMKTRKLDKIRPRLRTLNIWDATAAKSWAIWSTTAQGIQISRQSLKTLTMIFSVSRRFKTSGNFSQIPLLSPHISWKSVSKFPRFRSPLRKTLTDYLKWKLTE